MFFAEATKKEKYILFNFSVE